MRILFTTQPTLSHWQPLVPLAQAAQSAGHEIVFASAPTFCQRVEANGFRCFCVGRDDTREERQQRRAQMAGMNAQEDTFFTLRDVFAGVRAECSLPDMLSAMREWLPDVVVHENTEFAGCIAAERLGIAHVMLQISAPWAFFLDAISPPLMRLRESLGLAPTSLTDVLYRDLLLFPRPPSLWNPAVPAPPTLRSFRYRGFAQSGDETLPPWVARLPQQPTVYATLGTFENAHTHVFAAILDALRDEPLNLIVTVGRNRDPSEFGAQPPNVHVERYIPQTMLLPHCDLVVCHGGSGTIMDALSLGLPLVLIPIAADQPENAQRCEQVGVAHVIEPYTRPDLALAIRDATRDVLTNPRYRRAARELQREIEALPPLAQVVDWLADLQNKTPRQG
ncbi:MAG: glycosyltransferase [Chloroflexi bacterium]|nr:glycosyltransferase [Chloroflexota bacterium]